MAKENKYKYLKLIGRVAFCNLPLYLFGIMSIIADLWVTAKFRG